MGKNVLISGAGIAGPALAYWLGRYGFKPTVVELAPALRDGGQAVDFRGEAHLTVLERMGVLAELRRIQTGGRTMRFVDEHGRQLLHLPAEFTGGDVEVLRGDLARVLYEHSLPVPSTSSATRSPASPRPLEAYRSPSSTARRASSTS